MKALVCISQGVGNVVMATPLVQAVHDLGYAVDVYCDARCNAASLLRGWAAVGHVFTSWGDLSLLQAHYDVICRGSWCRLRWPPAFLQSRDYLSPDILDMRVYHETAVNMTVAHKLGYAGPTPPAHCEADEPGVALPQEYTAICPGYGSERSPQWDRKLWPHWRNLCNALADCGTHLVCVGSSLDTHLGELPVDVDLRGLLSLRASAGVLAGAERVIAIDNGLAHVAAALGVETAVLFGFTSPLKNRPLGRGVRVLTAGLDCQPCQLRGQEQTCVDAQCMRQLSAGKVLEGIA